MKDLRFSGHLDSVNQDEHFRVGIRFRTDLTTDTIADGTNFTVLEVKLDDEDLKDHHEEFFGANFRQLPYNVKAFKDFATDNLLDLDIEDSNGENQVKLVNASASVSESTH